MRPRPPLRRVRAAAWALRAAIAARRQLAGGQMPPLDLPPVPELPDSSTWTVNFVLDKAMFTCLVRATVRQAWHAAHGWQRDLVIGVRPPDSDFEAHAWLEGDDPRAAEGYYELTRRGPA